MKLSFKRLFLLQKEIVGEEVRWFIHPEVWRSLWKKKKKFKVYCIYNIDRESRRLNYAIIFIPQYLLRTQLYNQRLQLFHMSFRKTWKNTREKIFYPNSKQAI